MRIRIILNTRTTSVLLSKKTRDAILHLVFYILVYIIKLFHNDFACSNVVAIIDFNNINAIVKVSFDSSIFDSRS